MGAWSVAGPGVSGCVLCSWAELESCQPACQCDAARVTRNSLQQLTTSRRQRASRDGTPATLINRDSHKLQSTPLPTIAAIVRAALGQPKRTQQVADCSQRPTQHNSSSKHTCPNSCSSSCIAPHRDRYGQHKTAADTLLILGEHVLQPQKEQCCAQPHAHKKYQQHTLDNSCVTRGAKAAAAATAAGSGMQQVSL